MKIRYFLLALVGAFSVGYQVGVASERGRQYTSDPKKQQAKSELIAKLIALEERQLNDNRRDQITNDAPTPVSSPKKRGRPRKPAPGSAENNEQG